MKLSIILPAYNESENIVKVVNIIHNICKYISHEIIVVDDHSPDKTYDLIKNNPNARSFLHPGSRGLGQSILYGIKQSRGEIILGMDADGNHDPHVIPSLIGELKNSDLVVASRFLPGGGMSDKKRYWMSFLFNTLLQWMKFPVTDNTSGFYAIRKTTLTKLNPGSIYNGYGEYHLRLVWFACKKGLTIKEVPVYYGERLGGKSKSNLLSMAISYTYEAIRTYLKGIK